MKKLMIALAAVAMAAGVHAASVDWEAAGKSVYHQDGVTFYEGVQYYIINTSAAGYDQAKLIAALTDGSMTAEKLALESYFVESKAGNTGTKSPAAVAAHTVEAGSFVDQSAAALAYVIFDTVDDKDYFLLSSAASGKAYEPGVSEGTKVTFDSSHYAGSTTGWTTVAAPEPTSGLLLLLGVAGLALRRRRA